MSRRLLAVSVCVLSMFILCTSLHAAPMVVNPSLFGSTRDDSPNGFKSPFDSTAGGTVMQLGLRQATGFDVEWNSWLQFEIPDLGPFVSISSAVLTIDVGSTRWPNGSHVPGVRVYYMDDDSWTSTTITDTHAVTSTYVDNRDWFNNVPHGTNEGPRSNDITSWLSLPGEGEGQVLSMKLDRLGGGKRGASGVTAYLTLETEVMPEPATLTGLALGLGALLARRRRST